MYQPRGVGLMHTRHKPSNAHYTHASEPQRKYRNGNAPRGCRKRSALDTCRELPICTICRQLSRRAALC
ncbi:hypothetical protein BST38_04705 [Mycolicibacterium parafortuitum]|nr:hypothetical protein BST38_04705 [Mycolicibacterium parafortuitum]